MRTADNDNGDNHMTCFPPRQALRPTPIVAAVAAATMLFATGAIARHADTAEASAVEGKVPSVVMNGMRRSIENKSW
jgi:hypothetical protein